MDITNFLIDLSKKILKELTINLDRAVIFAGTAITLVVLVLWQFVVTLKLPYLLFLRISFYLYAVIIPIVYVARKIQVSFLSVRGYRRRREVIRDGIRKDTSMFRHRINYSDGETDIEKYVEPDLISAEDFQPNSHIYGQKWSVNQVLQQIISAGLPGVFIWGLAGSGKSALAQKLANELSAPQVPDDWLFIKKKFYSKHSKSRWIDLSGLLEKLGLRLAQDDYYFPYPILVDFKGQKLQVVTENINKTNIITDLLRKFGYDKFVEHMTSKDFSGQAAEFNNWLQQGLIIPIFDGLDELDADDQMQFLAGLFSYIEDYPKSTPFIVTLRDPNLVADFVQEPNQQIFRILPFTDHQISLFVQRYFKNKHQIASANLLNMIFNTAERYPRIRAIFSEPLLLTTIVSLYKGEPGETLPTNRSAIFNSYMKRLWKLRTNVGKTVRDAFPQDTLASCALRSLEDERNNIVPSVDKQPQKDKEQHQIESLDQLVVWRSERGYVFAHESYGEYFAAIKLAHDFSQGRIREKALNSGIKDLELVSKVAPSVAPKSLAQFSMQMKWRNVLAFALSIWLREHLSSFRVGEQNQALKNQWLKLTLIDETPMRYVMKYLQEKKTPQAHIFMLRLLNVLQEQVGDDIEIVDMLYCLNNSNPDAQVSIEDAERLTQQIIDWIYEFWKYQKPEDSYYWRSDLVEAAQGFDSRCWKIFDANLNIPSKSQETLSILSVLRHPQVVGILVKLLETQPHYFEQIRSIISEMGFLANRTLYDVCRDSLRKKQYEFVEQLIELMGSAGYAQKTSALFHDILTSSAKYPENVSAAVLLALARWGKEGEPFLKGLLPKAKEYSKSLQAKLIDAYVRLRLDYSQLLDLVNNALSLDSQLIMNLDLDLQQPMSARYQLPIIILRQKIQKDIQKIDIVALFQNMTRHYQPLSRRRKFLGWLSNHSPYIVNIQSKPPLYDRMIVGLFYTFRQLDRPSAKILRAVTEIYKDVVDDVSKSWFTLCLQDKCDENLRFTKQVFAITSANLQNPKEWLDEIQDLISEEDYQEIDYLIENELAKTQIVK